MNQYLKTVLASIAVLAVAVPAANASPLLFQLTGSKSATFQLDSNPVPSFSNTSFLGTQIQFSNVSGTFGGMAGVASSIGFGTGPILAQLNINGTSLGFAQFGGPDLFSGTATAPVFSPGTFNLTSIVSGASTLKISAVQTQPVPEPSSWSMILGSVAVLGFTARRRGRKISAA